MQGGTSTDPVAHSQDASVAVGNLTDDNASNVNVSDGDNESTSMDLGVQTANYEMGDNDSNEIEIDMVPLNEEAHTSTSSSNMNDPTNEMQKIEDAVAVDAHAGVSVYKNHSKTIIFILN